MADPVVHFEILGPDPAALRGYYRELFGWEPDTDSPVAPEVSDPGDYGFLDLITAPDGSGIRGGIGGGPGRAPRAVFYVGVDDVDAALAHAIELGGEAVMGPAANPNGQLTVAWFRDPAGNVIGLAGPTP